MPSVQFQAWYNWAVAEGSGWERVAENASRPARFRDAARHVAFQDAIGATNPRDDKAFSVACLPYHLTGQVVGEHGLAAWLTRLVSAAGFENGLRHVAGGSTVGDCWRERPSVGHWSRVDQLLASREDADELLFIPARVLDETHPEDRAVFATFDPGDPPPNPDPRPALLQRAEANRPPGGTLAESAVWLLATEPRPGPGMPVRSDEKTLIHYPRGRAGQGFFPVPPDAGWHPRFRAVTSGDSQDCGRTWPEGYDAASHAAGTCGECEIVHGNSGIPCAEMYVISLGQGRFGAW